MFFTPTVLGGIGAGLNLLGGLFGASQRKATANLNFAISSGNALMERENTLAALDLGRVRNQIAFDNAGVNLQLALADSEARERNSDALREFAEARTTQSREAIRRKMRSFDEFASSQRRAAATAGVSDSGSVLDVMIDSAFQMTLTLQDAWNEATSERRELLRREGIERWGAGQSRIAAEAEFGSARMVFDLGEAAALLGEMSADSNYRSSMFAAKAGLLTGQSAARGQALASFGGLVGDIGRLLT